MNTNFFPVQYCGIQERINDFYRSDLFRVLGWVTVKVIDLSHITMNCHTCGILMIGLDIELASSPRYIWFS